MLPNPGAGRVSSSTERSSQAAMSTFVAQSFCRNASIHTSFIMLSSLYFQGLTLEVAGGWSRAAAEGTQSCTLGCPADRKVRNHPHSENQARQPLSWT